MRKGVRGNRGQSDHERVAPTCGRPDCSRPASARLMLDITNRIVSVDANIHEVGAGMLCYGHAERIVVPRGWTLVDDREDSPRLFDIGAPTHRLPASPRPDNGEGLADAISQREHSQREHSQRDQQPDGPTDSSSSRPAKIRRERRRRVFPELQQAQRSATGPAADEDRYESDGQLSFATYDLPDQYRAIDTGSSKGVVDDAVAGPDSGVAVDAGVAVDVGTPAETDAVDGGVTGEVDSVDGSISPLLARAFDLSRSRRTPAPFDQDDTTH